MKKITIFSILTILAITKTLGQVDCSDLKLKNKELSSELVEKESIVSAKVIEIKKLNSEIQYYKETLELLNTKDTKESNNIIYRINSVKGKFDEGIIIVEGLIENKGISSKYQPQNIEIFDAKGNKHKATKFQIGDSKMLYVGKLERNIPIKFRFEFNGVLEEVPVLKALIFNFYNFTKISPVIFKNLPVNWE